MAFAISHNIARLVDYYLSTSRKASVASTFPVFAAGLMFVVACWRFPGCTSITMKRPIATATTVVAMKYIRAYQFRKRRNISGEKC